MRGPEHLRLNKQSDFPSVREDSCELVEVGCRQLEATNTLRTVPADYPGGIRVRHQRTRMRLFIGREREGGTECMGAWNFQRFEDSEAIAVTLTQKKATDSESRFGQVHEALRRGFSNLFESIAGVIHPARKFAIQPGRGFRQCHY